MSRQTQANQTRKKKTVIPGKIFNLQSCNQHGYSFIAATVSAKKITGGGRIDWPCSNFLCAPSKGTITIEYEFWPPAKSKESRSDDERGEEHKGIVKMTGQIGAKVEIAAANDVGGGAQIAITLTDSYHWTSSTVLSALKERFRVFSHYSTSK